MAGVFVTAFYSFRMLFLAFHGKERFADDAPAHDDAHAHDDAWPRRAWHAWRPPKESPWVVTVPLILLAIPSVYAGWAYIEPMLFGDYFGDSIVVRPTHAAMAELARGMARRRRRSCSTASLSLPFWLAVAGIVAAWYCYLVNPALPERHRSAPPARSTRCSTTSTTSTASTTGSSPAARARSARFLSNVGDRTIIDGFFVNGTARVVGWTASLLRHMQSGYVYHYAFTMIVGVFALLTWWTR